jgi:cobalt-zinc-cadmium efflux system protein
VPGVSRVHDLHIWAMGTSDIAMTTVLVMPKGNAGDALLEDITEHLHELFGIAHATIQVVQRPFTAPCGDLPEPADTSDASHVPHAHH